jgi:Glycosyl transferase family 2
MLEIIYAVGLLGLAAVPTLMFIRNLPLFKPASGLGVGLNEENSGIQFSVLIPARNEEATIERTLSCILANSYRDFEIVVLDDQSVDRTGEVVERLAGSDSRVRLVRSSELPAGWNGKQFACWQLAKAARHPWFVFLDADVRLSPDALARIAAELRQDPRDLLSGFPSQTTITLAERLLIPIMHVILLGYLPLDQMRSSRKPEFGAGCGQLFIAKRESYFQSGGHESIRSSRHDGLKLPRSFRKANLVTDLFDATDIAECRMYHSARQVFTGLLKNAHEGIAQPKLIGVFTVLLLGGQVLPLLSLGHSIYHGWPMVASIILLFATIVGYLPRAMAAKQFRQSWLGVALNPFAMLVFVGLQWWSLVRNMLGVRNVAWRGRVS